MPSTQALSAPPDRKPRDDEIDVYGLTHPGKVRKENQDHFLICALQKQMVQHTSLPLRATHRRSSQRLALLMMVADGVGGGAKGEEASRIALEAVTQYVTRSMRATMPPPRPMTRSSTTALKEAPQQCHAELLRRGRGGSRLPRHGHDAHPLPRCLAPRLPAPGGGQPLLPPPRRRADPDHPRSDDGAGADRPRRHARADAAATKLAHTLSSSIGGRQTAPVVTRFDLAWGNVVLLCSDGLTRHVPDERIRERLRSMTSSRQACEELLQDALDGGGSDNITIVIRRAVPHKG